MITVKQLIESNTTMSADHKHWEPKLPLPSPSFSCRLKDAFAVLTGNATAIRQTTILDLTR